MTPVEAAALLDAHDTLLQACIVGELSFLEFLAAYGEFPQGYPQLASDSALRGRLAFHRQVSGVLAGALTFDGSLYEACVARLKMLAVRFPEFSTG
jgi:nitrate reductase assembly molybdenum cofactor insertion protein NarJ